MLIKQQWKSQRQISQESACSPNGQRCLPTGGTTLRPYRGAHGNGLRAFEANASGQETSTRWIAVFSGQASWLKEEPLALNARECQEVFPNHSEHDPLVHANPNILTMSLYEGLAYLNQGDGKKALSTSEGNLFDGRFTAYRSASSLPERIRLEIINHQGQAAILSNNLDEYARCLEEGIAGARVLKSKKRFQEAFTTFLQDMPAAWRKDPQIKDISERYHLVAEAA